MVSLEHQDHRLRKFTPILRKVMGDTFDLWVWITGLLVNSLSAFCEFENPPIPGSLARSRLTGRSSTRLRTRTAREISRWQISRDARKIEPGAWSPAPLCHTKNEPGRRR